MSWFSYLCGCFDQETIMNYLSNTDLNRSIIEEEKTNETERAPRVRDDTYRNEVYYDFNHKNQRKKIFNSYN